MPLISVSCHPKVTEERGRGEGGREEEREEGRGNRTGGKERERRRGREGEEENRGLEEGEGGGKLITFTSVYVSLKKTSKKK